MFGFLTDNVVLYIFLFHSPLYFIFVQSRLRICYMVCVSVGHCDIVIYM